MFGLHPQQNKILVPAILVLLSVLTGCASPEAAPVADNSNKSAEAPPAPRMAKETQTGLASYLSDSFHGKRTYSGEVFDRAGLVAAHPSYPMGTILRITNLENDRSVEVRIVDRGPSKKDQENGIILDLSRSVAEQLDFISSGKARVRAEVLEWGDGREN